MAASFRQFDEHGLPLPQRYSDVKQYQLGQTDDETPRRPKISLRSKRVIFIGVVLSLIALEFGSHFVSWAWEFAARAFSQRAVEEFFACDNAAALSDANKAVYCNPKSIDGYRMRADVRLEMNLLEESLADFNRLIELLETHDETAQHDNRVMGRTKLLADTYAKRSWVFVRLNRRREAIDDANQAVRLAPTSEYLNTRAYARAVLNTELQIGLADVETALKNSDPNFPDYLDTRGYLLYLLDRPDEALKDMNRALKTTEQLQQEIANLPNEIKSRISPRELKHQNEALAVMYHHRGLIYEKLGRKEVAALDLKRGDELGYDPERGVF